MKMNERNMTAKNIEQAWRGAADMATIAYLLQQIQGNQSPQAKAIRKSFQKASLAIEKSLSKVSAEVSKARRHRALLEVMDLLEHLYSEIVKVDSKHKDIERNSPLKSENSSAKVQARLAHIRGLFSSAYDLIEHDHMRIISFELLEINRTTMLKFARTRSEINANGGPRETALKALEREGIITEKKTFYNHRKSLIDGELIFASEREQRGFWGYFVVLNLIEHGFGRKVPDGMKPRKLGFESLL